MLRTLAQVDKDIARVTKKINNLEEKLLPEKEKLEVYLTEKKEIEDRDFLKVCKENNISLEDLIEFKKQKERKEEMKENEYEPYLQEGI